MLLLALVFSLYLLKKKVLTGISLSKFLFMPIIATLLITAAAIISISKGYYLGILGYAIGHFQDIGSGNNPGFINYFKDLVWSQGLLIFLNLICLYIWARDTIITKKRKVSDIFEILFLIWNVCLLLFVFALRRLDSVLGLYLLPAIIFTIYYIKNLNKKFLYIIIIILFVQFGLSINMKYELLKLPFMTVSKYRFTNRDFGQKATGYWVRQNLKEDEQILIITPDSSESAFKYSSYYYAESVELYFKKIYTYCKGDAAKDLFTVRNIFNGRILYDAKNPPNMVIDFSGVENNFLKLKKYDNFPVDKYGRRAVILDEKEAIVACIYQKGWKKQVVTLKKESLDRSFDETYANFEGLVYSPYQGIWMYIP